ncbi:MAG: DUF3048 domain-containing protein [Bifidobacteriaceae bacterium]|nr:DUF3048 domain-containing protein [Bifidobacteriaceae bacterium]
MESKAWAARRRKRPLGVTGAVCGLALLAAAAGCVGVAPPLPTPTVFTTVTPAPDVDKTAPPSPAPVPTWPLTGLSGEIKKRPALAVKIENSPDARPQTGLEGADVVWEEIVEGGISRYVAVFHSTLPKEIGPIRSIRPMDGGIAGPTRGIMVFSGGKAPFVEMAREANLQVLSEDAGSGGFYRVMTRPAPHNVYADPRDFLKQADKSHKKTPPGEFDFARNPGAATAATAGRDADLVKLTMSGGAHPRWEWDAEDSVWLRSEGENPAVSAAGEQLSAVNVVAMEVEQRTAQGRDPAGNSIPESIVVGKGKGFVATGGKIIEVKWSKKAKTKPVVLKTADGSEVKLAPGNTWVELIPTAYGDWEATS